MKHLNLIMGIAFAAGMSLFTSCSKDEQTTLRLSRTIESVDVYSGSDDVYEKITTYRFVYIDDRLVKIEADKPATEVSFTYYASDSLNYSEVKIVDGITEWNKISVKLKDGKIRTCFSNTMGFMTYSYQNNFITSVVLGGNTVLDYEWDQGNLEITSTGLPSNGYYNTSFKSSPVVNEYSIDLNVLSQLVDNRKNYTSVMNTYGQMIGVLGVKNVYLLENTDYTYGYEYDRNGRLSSVSMVAKGSSSVFPASYTFKIKYSE